MKYAAKSQRRTIRLFISVAGALALSLSSSACSAPEREYTTPSSLCGTPVPSTLLESLLPPGKEISLRPGIKVDGIKRCRVYVDGREALSASIEWTEKGISLQEVAAQPYGVDASGHMAKDGQYIYSGTGAAGKIDCPNPRKSAGLLFATIRISEASPPNESAMKNLITAYAEEIANSDECTEKKS